MAAVAAALGALGASPELVGVTEADALSAALVTLGVLALVTLVLATVRWLLQLLPMLRGSPDLEQLCGTGTWACVTGATDGIGRAYALELARHGMPVLLLSRTEQKLEATADEVRALGVECDWLAVDMSQGEAIYPVIRTFLQNYSVGFLVNNVGASYDHAEFFAELPSEKVQQLLNMNIQTATMLCHAVLPQMEERSSGVIVNVSSWLGSRPCGLYSVYSASKAYVDILSRALAQEYAPKGVTIQSLMPQFVVSKLSKMRRSTLTCPTPENYVASALRSVGRSHRTTGYLSQQMTWWLCDMLPDAAVDYVLWATHADIRRRALRKKAKEGQAGQDGGPTVDSVPTAASVGRHRKGSSRRRSSKSRSPSPSPMYKRR